jgi:LacI family transcriptional regulator
MTVRLRDVAEAAGVHPATASRALNESTRGQVNGQTVERVLRAARKLKYVPNPIARGLKTSRSATIGVVISDLTNPLFPPIIRGIDDAASAAGFSTFVVNTDNDLAREQLQIDALRRRQVEGLIVSTAVLDHPRGTDAYDSDIPQIFILRTTKNLDTSSVTGNDAEGIAMAVEHLVRLGHTKIAHIAGPQDVSAGLVRLRAFRESLRDQGLAVDEGLIVPTACFREEDGAAALAALLDSGQEFTAVVAGNDMLALGCYDVVAARGLSCPADLSIVGFNGMPFLDKIAPPLTTVGLSHYNIGVEAARLLFDAINGPQHYTPRSVRMPVKLIVRGSTAPPRTCA